MAMKVPARMLRKIALTLLLTAAGLKFLFDWTMLHVRIAFASEQTQNFADFSQRALRAAPSEQAELLVAIRDYYPSGTKQITGSILDRIVERGRQELTRVVVANLKLTTGEDLGDDPQPWIQKYWK